MMVRRKIKPKMTYEQLGLKIRHFDARVDASTNYEARDKRCFYKDPKVFAFYTSIEIEGMYTYPENRVDQPFMITIYGSEIHEGEHERTLSEYQERDDDGQLKYRKVRGELTPIYKVPESIGYLECRKQRWSGVAWVTPPTVTNMLTLLPHVRPLYISISEVKEGRHRRIRALSLQTIDPAIE